jgi:hypothetical protein
VPDLAVVWIRVSGELLLVKVDGESARQADYRLWQDQPFRASLQILMDLDGASCHLQGSRHPQSSFKGEAPFDCMTVCQMQGSCRFLTSPLPGYLPLPDMYVDLNGDEQCFCNAVT